jgi:hypothetical protein
METIKTVAALTNLQDLELHGSHAYTTWEASDDALATLAAGLQQLTQLRIDPVMPAQLQLHLAVNLHRQPHQLLQLAEWLRHHSSCVRTLRLIQGPESYEVYEWTLAVAALAAVFKARRRRCHHHHQQWTPLLLQQSTAPGSCSHLQWVDFTTLP